MTKRKKIEVEPVDSQEMAVSEALACAEGADEVLVIALNADTGVEMHTSITYPPDMLWLLEIAKDQIKEMSNNTND